MDNAGKFFSLKLKKAKEKNNLTAKQISNKIGISEQSLWDYLAGTRLPKSDVLAKLAHTLNSTPDVLLGFDTDRKEPLKLNFNDLDDHAIDSILEDVKNIVLLKIKTEAEGVEEVKKEGRKNIQQVNFDQEKRKRKINKGITRKRLR